MNSKEAIDVLRLHNCPAWKYNEALAVLTALAEDYEKVKAEVERLKKLICSGDNEQARLFLHQAGVMAELATDRCRLIADNNCLKARAEKAEAELARWRPLIEAVEKASIGKYQDIVGGSTVLIPFISEGEDEIIRAALKCREVKP